MASRHGLTSLVPALTVLIALPAAADPALTFEEHVRPILKAYCMDCHGEQAELKGELDLRLRRFILRGGDDGPAIVPGKPDESLLLKKIKTGKMPPTQKKVPAEQVAVIERWIAEGAAAGRDEPESLPPGIDITPAERAHWAYQPLKRPAVPGTLPKERANNAIDAFLLAKLRERGQTFAPEADRRTLIVRASMDLTGLPPTVAEVESFVSDQSEDAYEKMIDRLLASPHYGERWARHWLDVAGYADSEGNGNDDSPRPHAYKYRDYVIRSFNADKPLDQFIIEQLAGDELVPQPWKAGEMPAADLDKLIATGFLRNAPDPTAGGGDLATNANLVVADTIKIVGSSLYGLTIACAQCHDHRYDPIPQADYFRLRAVFEPALNPADWRRPGQRMVSLFTDADRAKVAAVNAEAAKLREARAEKERKFIHEEFEKNLVKFDEALRGPLREAFMTEAGKRSAEQKKLLDANPSASVTPGVLYQFNQAKADELKKDAEAIAAVEAKKPVEDFVRVLSEVPGQVPVTKLHHRGDHRQPKDEMKPGDLTIAAPEGARFEIAAKDAAMATTGRRLALAKHLTSGKQPLLPRVLANRIWMHHFGRAIVETPGDFGALGVKPTHPELLDWLACELIEGRDPRTGVRGLSSDEKKTDQRPPTPVGGSPWSLKRLHKTIMMSAAYRQSSRAATGVAASDVALYARFPIQRLDAELIRDRMLFAAGVLDRTQLGPAIPVELDAVGQAVAKGDSPRRSIYLEAQRTKPLSFLAAFDVAQPSPNCERRVTSTTSPQALMLMNSEFVLKRAGEMAARVRRETPGDFAEELAKSAPVSRRPADAWSFGYGALDEASQRVSTFTALPHFTGGAWQGGAALPDAKLGWVILHGGGGHTGDNPGFASIRRFTAPRTGKLAITGKLSHPSEHGDGVRGRIVSSRAGIVGTWTAKTNEQTTNVAAIEVHAGDTIDFVADCIANVNSDSFNWVVDVTINDGKSTSKWDSAADFHGPLIALPRQVAYAWSIAYLRPITSAELERAMAFIAAQLDTMDAARVKGDRELMAMTNLCQQLLSSNEFLYVD